MLHCADDSILHVGRCGSRAYRARPTVKALMRPSNQSNSLCTLLRKPTLLSARLFRPSSPCSPPPSSRGPCLYMRYQARKRYCEGAADVFEIVASFSSDERSLVCSSNPCRLVEDNLINSKLGQRMLTTLGYHVLLAYDGLQAVETVKKAHGSIHAILMDCQVRIGVSQTLSARGRRTRKTHLACLHKQMPVMNGEESTKEIRKYEAENGLGKIAIMALSANVNKDSSNRIMDAGADGFLGKPISLRQLDEALKYIDSHISE